MAGDEEIYDEKALKAMDQAARSFVAEDPERWSAAQARMSEFMSTLFGVMSLMQRSPLRACSPGETTSRR